jgi:hypothetical protein
VSEEYEGASKATITRLWEVEFCVWQCDWCGWAGIGLEDFVLNGEFGASFGY